LRDVDKSIQEGFRAWFLGFRPEYQVERVFILSLGKVDDVQSQESASPSETVNSHDRNNL
jgi:hypothetical protein